MQICLHNNAQNSHLLFCDYPEAAYSTIILRIFELSRYDISGNSNVVGNAKDTSA